MSQDLPVTRTTLPPFDEYVERLRGIWERGHITNHGPLVLELEARLREKLGVRHLFFVSNGTLALQIALRALELNGEIITTPFSYVATTSSLVWERCTPVFADIERDSLTISPERVAQAITPRTTAVLATHVYGNPCRVDALAALCRERGLKLVYDAAHAFGVSVDGRPIAGFGDISTFSFHATKLFHTVEGGAVATNDDALAHRISYLRNFGHNGQEAFFGLGINGKNCELHAAMGLCLLPRIDALIAERRALHAEYDRRLLANTQLLRKPGPTPGAALNFAYYPVLFRDEVSLLRARTQLNAAGISPRRYFFPPLSQLPYVSRGDSAVAEEISPRVLCLPLFSGLSVDDIARVSDTLLLSLGAA